MGIPDCTTPVPDRPGQPAPLSGDNFPVLLDRHARPLRNLRLSVTDRCNLRCHYCMPEDEYVWLPREHLLTLDEISRVADLFGALGVTKIRLTGGEPLLRKRVEDLVAMLASLKTLDGHAPELTLTTNGSQLGRHADALVAAGVRRIEAITGEEALRRFQSAQAQLAGVASLLAGPLSCAMAKSKAEWKLSN